MVKSNEPLIIKSVRSDIYAWLNCQQLWSTLLLSEFLLDL